VLRDFRADGVKGVVLTPHLRASDIEVHGDAHIERRERALRELEAQAPADAELYPGFEIMLDQPLPTVVTQDRRYALAGSRY
jgi:tyrosine-protein phosphatase YwqE